MEEEKDVKVISFPKEISLEERFKNYDGLNLCKDFDWGEDVGREKLVNIDNS